MNQSVDNNFYQRCEMCGSYNLVKGIIGNGIAGFIQEGRSSMSALRLCVTVCKDCGHVFDFKINEKHRLK